MDYTDLQPALDGLAPKTRKKKKAPKTPADSNPIARVVLDVQAAHLGRTFDYLVEQKYSATALPGVRVRVRFGGKLLDGVVWERAESSTTDYSLLRYIERVISPIVMVDEAMRADIDRIANMFGGTRANILRVAIPPRVAHVEHERGWSSVSHSGEQYTTYDTEKVGTDQNPPAHAINARYLDFETRRVAEEYSGADAAALALGSDAWKKMVWDCLPGPHKWAEDFAWALAQALASGKSVVACLPHSRAVGQLASELGKYGLQRLVSDSTSVGASGGSHVVGEGDFAVIDSSETQESRYRSYVALCSGAVRAVIGTRAAMYAPVQGAALFAVMDDNAYQNADGFMPYANVRDVLDIRARAHHGVFLALGLGRSPQSQYDVDAVGTKTLEVHGYPNAIKQARPWIRWMGPDQVRALGDTTAGSRVPHTVSTVLRKAAERGPVLVSVPYEGFTEVLSCAQCHRQARCRRCSGPLHTRGNQLPVCAWCARPAAGWTCRFCGGDKFRAVRVGAQGTAGQIRTLFPGLPIVISTPAQPRGVVARVDASPRVVIATPGAQPEVIGGHYQSLAILDAWTSMYSQALDSQLDTLEVWMALSSLVVPGDQGGQVLLVGQCSPDLAGSLVAWDPRILARKTNQERAEAGLPPSVCAATVWGKYSAVMETLGQIGALDGDFSTIQVPRSALDSVVPGEDAEGTEESASDELPSVMGPIEIPPAPTLRNRVLEGSNDRSRAIVRVPRDQQEELARRLHVAAADRSIRRLPGELRFWINPKDLRQR